ncbi:MAG: hypothetical protein K0B16_06960 [Burkholderiaceae bacterium]|nr:hypothetical protein [Burkholderiaceae bacterium]
MLGAALAATPMVIAIRSLYGVTQDLNHYVNGLITDMKGSDTLDDATVVALRKSPVPARQPALAALRRMLEFYGLQLGEGDSDQPVINRGCTGRSAASSGSGHATTTT